MNTFFWHREIHKCTWYRDSVGQRSIIDFCIISAELVSSVIDVCVKREAKLSTDHHLVVCILRGLNHPITTKRFRAQRAYKIMWELLADKKVRHTFVCKLLPCSENYLTKLKTLRLSGIYLNQQSLHVQLLVVVANVWVVKLVVKKELFSGIRKLKNYP